MTAAQWEIIFEALTKTVSEQQAHIAVLDGKLKDSDNLVQRLRVAISNIAGMALDQFPELAQAYGRERDPYELIRQCFLKMRGQPR